MRRSLTDPAWADAVFLRYQRRRDLPRRRLDQAWRDLGNGLLDAYRPFLEWQLRHFWVVVIGVGVMVGMATGLTILGWYEVR